MDSNYRVLIEIVHIDALHILMQTLHRLMPAKGALVYFKKNS